MTNNLEYYKVFYYVAVNKSITAAAKELSISQPAVSQAIRQLEDWLEVVLFLRSSKGVTLTREGEVLFNYISKGYELIETGERKVKQMLSLEYGEVRIGASDMTLQFFLLPYLEKFHEKFPGVKVTVTNGPTPETLQFLEEEKIDFGLVSTPIMGQHDLEFRNVKDIEDIFVAGRHFIGLKNKTLDLTDLENLPLICLEGQTSTRKYMEDFLEANGIHIAPEFELATSDMIVQFALKSLGVGMVMKDFAEPYLKDGRLFKLRFNKMIPKRNFCVATKADAPLSFAAKSLLEMIE